MNQPTFDDLVERYSAMDTESLQDLSCQGDLSEDGSKALETVLRQRGLTKDSAKALSRPSQNIGESVSDFSPKKYWSEDEEPLNRLISRWFTCIIGTVVIFAFAMVPFWISTDQVNSLSDVYGVFKSLSKQGHGFLISIYSIFISLGLFACVLYWLDPWLNQFAVSCRGFSHYRKNSLKLFTPWSSVAEVDVVYNNRSVGVTFIIRMSDKTDYRISEREFEPDSVKLLLSYLDPSRFSEETKSYLSKCTN